MIQGVFLSFPSSVPKAPDSPQNQDKVLIEGTRMRKLFYAEHAVSPKWTSGVVEVPGFTWWLGELHGRPMGFYGCMGMLRGFSGNAADYLGF